MEIYDCFLAMSAYSSGFDNKHHFYSQPIEIENINYFSSMEILYIHAINPQVLKDYQIFEINTPSVIYFVIFKNLQSENQYFMFIDEN